MAILEGVARTDLAERYIVKLCKHWSHRFSVEVQRDKSVIDFGSSRVELSAQDGMLKSTLYATEDQLSELKDAIVDHIGRFTRRGDDLEFQWTSKDEIV